MISSYGSHNVNQIIKYINIHIENLNLLIPQGLKSSEVFNITNS